MGIVAVCSRAANLLRTTRWIQVIAFEIDIWRRSATKALRCSDTTTPPRPCHDHATYTPSTMYITTTHQQPGPEEWRNGQQVADQERKMATLTFRPSRFDSWTRCRLLVTKKTCSISWPACWQVLPDKDGRICSATQLEMKASLPNETSFNVGTSKHDQGH